MASCWMGVGEDRKCSRVGFKGSPGAYRSGKTTAAVFVVMYTSWEGGLDVGVVCGAFGWGRR